MILCVAFVLCFELFLASSNAKEVSSPVPTPSPTSKCKGTLKGCNSAKAGNGSKSKTKCPVVSDVVTPNLIVNEVNEPGFGDVNNKYSLAMASFKDYVYVGTLNAPGFPQDLLPWFLGEPLESDGAKVYRGQIGRSGEWEWNEVLDLGSNKIGTPNNFGVRSMLVVDDFLYFVTVNHEGTQGNGVEVWQTKDGGPGDWFQRSDPGFGDPSNISGRSLAKCGGYLYVGAENRDTGAQLWRHQLLNDGDLQPSASWEAVPAANGGVGNPNNYFISELVLNPWSTDELYAGTLNGLNGMELWRITSCGESDVNRVGASNTFVGGWPRGPVTCPLPTVDGIDLCSTNSGAITLKTAETNLGPALFLGTVNFFFGASLFVSFDGNSFIPIFLFGNGDIRLSYVWSMEVYRGRLYIGTFQRFNLQNFFLSDGPDVGDGTIPPESINPEDAMKYMQLLEGLGGSTFLPVIPGITDHSNDINLDEVVATGEFTLFSLDLAGFNSQANPVVETVTETSDSFGTCNQFGIRNLVVHEEKLMIGSAGAVTIGGTLVFEAVGLK